MHKGYAGHLLIEDDLLYLEVGTIVHSKWLILRCRILRFYVSLNGPSPTLKIVVHFCLTVYFPTWFNIKLNHQITHGFKHLFNLIQRINSLFKVALDQGCPTFIDMGSTFTFSSLWRSTNLAKL